MFERRARLQAKTTTATVLTTTRTMTETKQFLARFSIAK